MDNQLTLNKKAKQPLKLYLVSLVSLCERYGYYAMQGIIVLYMIKVLSFSDSLAYSTFAIFSALFYLMPVVGGYIADRFWGTRNALIVGGIILACGYALLSLPGTVYFYMALAAITVGGGLFIPNIATAVSYLYQKDDGRREGGYSIFYTAINIGSFIPPLIVPFLIKVAGWGAAFLMASCSVLLAVIFFIFFVRKMPEMKKIERKSLSLALIVPTVMILIAWLLITMLLENTFHANIVIFGFSAMFVLFTLNKIFNYEKEQRKKLLVCLILIVLSIVFGVLYQQAAMSLTIYTKYNVQRDLGGWSVPTVMFRSLNPFYIIILGPVLAQLWAYLSRKTFNPSIAVKFGMGTIFMGLGFVTLMIAIALTARNGEINLWWIVLSYLLQTIGEMFVSPIGLSMVSELSPVKMMGLMMGAWYFATAVADALAGFVSIWTTVPSGTNNSLITSSQYMHTFGMIGMVSVITGVIILVISPFLCSMIGKKIFDV